MRYHRGDWHQYIDDITFVDYLIVLEIALSEAFGVEFYGAQLFIVLLNMHYIFEIVRRRQKTVNVGTDMTWSVLVLLFLNKFYWVTKFTDYQGTSRMEFCLPAWWLLNSDLSTFLPVITSASSLVKLATCRAFAWALFARALIVDDFEAFMVMQF